ncbi:hypothetical protein [Geitlerinema calcuttense]|uniref:VRR-NUC domain-containing protein n=1 Tax=Geitlerinema calcuttense NRMC-F 0142 TaxID=2922238 RepID=A0ABT7LXU1_9CYAN|nr:hypothetical protein [Geitlerinema calcuttense]MDL5055925.1 hypothetical protein [Geitlerinema calcuttense NRMC-F 0142]
MSKYARKKDSNHKGICETLTACGVTVVDCSASGTIPDLLVWYRGKCGWLEIKMIAKSDPRYTAKQLKWIAETPMPVRIVTNDQEALAFAQTHQGALTSQQKDDLAAFLLRNEGKELFTPKQVTEALNSKG